jgi:hypothetical protein
VSGRSATAIAPSTCQRAELVEIVWSEQAEAFVYSGDRHLFTHSSLPLHEEDATAMVLRRSRLLLSQLS